MVRIPRVPPKRVVHQVSASITLNTQSLKATNLKSPFLCLIGENHANVYSFPEKSTELLMSSLWQPMRSVLPHP